MHELLISKISNAGPCRASRRTYRHFAQGMMVRLFVQSRHGNIESKMRGLNGLERFKDWSLLIAKGQTLYGVFRLSKTQDEDCGVFMFDCIMED